MMYLRMSLRNIKKNIRKNVLTMTMISFGIVALYVYTGSNTQMFRQFRESVIRDQYGHFQLYSKGYLDEESTEPYQHMITDYHTVAQSLMEDDDIDFLAPRLHFSGVGSSDERSILLKGFGGDPEVEKRMEYASVSSGVFINPDTRYQAVVGENVLAKSASNLGEYLTVLATMNGGGVSAMDFCITGTKQSYGETDRLNDLFILADLASVQELLDLKDSVDTIIVHLASGVNASKKEKDIQQFCKKWNLEYRRWDDLAVFYERSRQVFSMNEQILTAIILVISIFIIINTLYMAYMARMREIGTMRAMGTTKAQITRIILGESMILSLCGCLSGFVIALLISFFVYLSGGMYHPPTVFNQEPYYTYIQPQPSTILCYVFLFMLVSAIASAVISIRAHRYSIADSLRWN
ncbi:MAG: ABC transporter permease [Spirochaetales bacterium]|nr:ABC transporter permease [Spirochaetales bacterium]